MTNTPENYGALWTKEELLLAFELYCRIPFRLTKANNPEVKKLAALLKRSPASVARKLGNFGAFDPELKEQNITGLAHASRLDAEVWEEFHKDWNGLVWKARELRQSLNPQERAEEDLIRPSGPSEKTRIVKQRVHQSFFRDAILSSYEETCCITGLRISECLIASHIVPWSADENLRTDPTNGLCLSATFDRLFDSGLITLCDNYTVLISQTILRWEDKRVADVIGIYDGNPMIRPRRFMPAPEHLKWHRENVFRG